MRRTGTKATKVINHGDIVERRERILLYNNTGAPAREHPRAYWLSVESRERGWSSEQGLILAHADRYKCRLAADASKVFA